MGPILDFTEGGWKREKSPSIQVYQDKKKLEKDKA